MSAKRPGIKGKSRKARDKAHARREQITRKRKAKPRPHFNPNEGFGPI